MMCYEKVKTQSTFNIFFKIKKLMSFNDINYEKKKNSFNLHKSFKTKKKLTPFNDIENSFLIRKTTTCIIT